MPDIHAPVGQNLLNGFLAYLHNERRYSPLTAENYARDINRLLSLAGTTPLSELKSHHIRRFVRGQCVGQIPRRLGRAQADTRITRTVMVAHHVTKKTAPG